MLCQNCGEREATIHEVLIDASNEKHEKHLCEVCAAGGDPPSAKDELPTPVGELISKFMVGGAPGQDPPQAPAPRAALACHECGTTYTAFKQSGLLGCPSCYAAFATRLSPLLERAHEGGSNHVGKLPKRTLHDRELAGETEAVLGDAAERTRRIVELERALAAAVNGERYEEAAELKQDIERIRALSHGEEASDA